MRGVLGELEVGGVEDADRMAYVTGGDAERADPVAMRQFRDCSTSCGAVAMRCR